MQDTWVQSLGWEDSLEKERQPAPVFLPGKSHGERSLVGSSPRGCKKRTQLSEWSTIFYVDFLIFYLMCFFCAWILFMITQYTEWSCVLKLLLPKRVSDFSCIWWSWEASLVAQAVKRLPAMQETWVRSLGWEDTLEKEMATHSSILAWKIAWMEEPGRLQSMWSQRVRHDWVTSFSLCQLWAVVRDFIKCSSVGEFLIFSHDERRVTHFGRKTKGVRYHFST